MSTNKENEPKKSSKDELVNEITLQLSTALPALKAALGDKKFEKRIRKAAKLLTGGIKTPTPKAKPAVKAAPAKKSPAKKAAAKKAAPVKKTAKKK